METPSRYELQRSTGNNSDVTRVELNSTNVTAYYLQESLSVYAGDVFAILFPLNGSEKLILEFIDFGQETNLNRTSYRFSSDSLGLIDNVVNETRYIPLILPMLMTTSGEISHFNPYAGKKYYH